MSRFVVRFAFPDSTRTCHERHEEQAALHLASELVGRAHPHVTIEAWDAEPATFAVRHLILQPDGAVSDCGWRAWVDGLFIGTVEHWPMAEQLVGV